MAIRDRISQFVTYLVKQIKCSQGGILIGRVTGEGKAQEITVGSGLTLSGTTLTVTGGTFAAASHTHALSDLSQSAAESGQVVTWNGSAWSASTIPSSTGGNGTSDSGKLVKFDSNGAITVSWLKLPQCQSQDAKTISPLIYPPDYGSTNAGTSFESIYKLPLLDNMLPDTVLAKTSRTDGAVSYNDLVDVPASVSLTASKSVANAAARLALSVEAAQGFAVVDADTGKTWMLVDGGTPSVSGDWLQLGDREITAADIADTSTAGGAGKIPVLDGNGNLITGTFTNDNVALNPGGNIHIPDKRGMVWYNQGGGTQKAAIWNWDDHGPQELIIDSENRIALGFRSTLQVGVNDNVAYPRNVELVTGGINDAYPTKSSALLSLRMLHQPTSDPASIARKRISFQGVPLDRAGNARVLRIWDDAIIGNDNGGSAATGSTSGEIIGGTMMAEFAVGGVYTPGQAPAFSTLTPGATITQTCSKYKTVQAAKVTLDRASSALAISGAEAGMRGVIYVSQDSTGSRALSLPAASVYASGFALSTTATLIDRLEWEYDGANFFWTITNGLQLAFDSDAQSFITAASLSDHSQKIAVNTLVLGLKAASIWSKFDALYPFVGGTAAAHAKDLKGAYNMANAADSSWTADVTHNANGITGNGTSGRGDTGIQLSVLGRTNSAFGYAYSRSTDITASSYLFGATDTYRFGINRGSATTATAHGPNDAGTSMAIAPIPNWKGHFAIRRDSSTTKTIWGAGLTASSGNDGAVGAPANAIQILCRKYSGPYGGFSNANLAFAAFGQSLSDSEFATFTALIDAFETALGRAN